MKRILVLLLLAGLGTGGWLYWKRTRAVGKADAPELPTAQVESGPIELTVASTGRVVANLEVEIKCKASGEVVKLPYDVSQSVQKGKLLVELDPIDEERKVKQAEVTLAASQAKAKQAEEGLSNAKLNLATSKRRADVAIKVAQAKAKQAEQNLLLAERDLATSKDRAAAALKAAEVKAQDGKSKADRAQRLLDQGLISREEFDTARTAAAQADSELDGARVRLAELKAEEQALEVKRQDVLLAEANLETARIRLDEIKAEEQALEVKRQEMLLAAAQVESNRIDLTLAQRRLQDTKVVAPMNGVVTTRNVQIGQIISSGISNVGGGTTLLTLSDLSRIFILASVDESDIGKVEADQQAVITADAFAGRRFTGKVDRVAPKGVVNSNVVTFEVKLEVLGRNKALLRPEMTANVEIQVAKKDSTLLVPTEAVVRQGRQRVAVVLKDDGTQEERQVKTGISDGVKLEILEGLAAGERVLVHTAEADSAWRRSRSGLAGGRMVLGGARRSR